VTLERDRLIQQMEVGIVKCHELHAQLTEGNDFYKSISKRSASMIRLTSISDVFCLIITYRVLHCDWLGLHRLQQIKTVAEDQAYSQDLQRKDFELELSNSAHR